ncbi:MAG: 4Fe-4S binding protein [Lachnospiraceae bacterium]|nr:4Fe-4S binding protein [Lachnospiraceae bacterium]
MKKNRRPYVQLLAAVLYNCNITGFAKGKIYKGKLKGLCAPGLNCYSCPGAVASCPLGSLQSGLLMSKYKIPCYVLGTLLLLGLLFGRLICGFLCPFGLLQDLLDKIPLPKIKKNRITRVLSYLKYLILLAFVIVIPLVRLVPGFCKYICPAGTLEGGIPLTAADGKLRGLIGTLFSWKVFVLCLILLLCMFCYRAFCRFLCPLGALYSFFNPVSFFGIRVDEKKCTHCDACVRNCKMDIKKVCDRECIHCGECIAHCPVNAISYQPGGRFSDRPVK